MNLPDGLTGQVKDDAPAVGPGGPSVWAALFFRRLREPAFWAIQAGVLAITATHLVAEGLEVFAEGTAFDAGLHQLPVILYLIPIVYAGLRYGLEGAMLTGAWCIVLTVPNIVVWHAQGAEWVAELLYVSFVVAVGIVVALPVERERRQRERLAETSRRLALLNEVGSALVSTGSFDDVVPGVLDRLREVLGLASAAVAWREHEPPAPPDLWVSATPGEADRARTAVLNTLRPSRSDEGDGGGTLLALPLLAERPAAGTLVVLQGPREPLGASDQEVLRAVAGEIGVALDNARLHRQERQGLRSYVREVTRALEEERRHLARELHDTAAQDLVRLSRGLDAAAEAAPAEEDARRLAELRGLAGQTLESLRRLSRDLRPTVLDDLGLLPALEWLAADLQRRTGIQSDFSVDGGLRRLPAEAELALFRITQETLRNAERHAGAARVGIHVAFDRDTVLLEVTDDGRGFVPTEPRERLAQAGKLGILGMHERAQLISGALEIRSAPGQGTRVSVAIGPPDRPAESVGDRPP